MKEVKHLRHELKHEINYADYLDLKMRLSAVLKSDIHGQGGKYEIRSLYFDNLYDKALREKLDGVNIREKFRIRMYDGDTSFINLEKKSKFSGLGEKASDNITEDEVRRLLSGDYSWMTDEKRPVVNELYAKMKTQGLRPKTIVDYTREAYIFSAGNVRITLDSNIRTMIGCTDMLDYERQTVPVCPGVIILEVKWDDFLPEIIRNVVMTDSRRAAAFSKYAACRIYG